MEDIIERTLRQYYLVRELPSFLGIIGEISAESAAEGFQATTRLMIMARFDAMDQPEVLRKRKAS